MMDLLIEITHLVALACLGWYAFRQRKPYRHFLYYVTDDGKIMGVTHNGKAELIHDAGQPVTGIVARHEPTSGGDTVHKIEVEQDPYGVMVQGMLTPQRSGEA